jgi:hypothetical protein
VASRSQIPQLVVDLDGGSPTIVPPAGFDAELEGAEVLLLHAQSVARALDIKLYKDFRHIFAFGQYSLVRKLDMAVCATLPGHSPRPQGTPALILGPLGAQAWSAAQRSAAPSALGDVQETLQRLHTKAKVPRMEDVGIPILEGRDYFEFVEGSSSVPAGRQSYWIAPWVARQFIQQRKSLGADDKKALVSGAPPAGHSGSVRCSTVWSSTNLGRSRTARIHQGLRLAVPWGAGTEWGDRWRDAADLFDASEFLRRAYVSAEHGPRGSKCQAYAGIASLFGRDDFVRLFGASHDTWVVRCRPRLSRCCCVPVF